MTPTESALLPPALVVRHDDTVPVLVLPADMPFDRLREWLRTELPNVRQDLGGGACRLDLGAREIQLFDVRRLLNLLRDEFQLDVTGLYVRADAVHRYAERELKLKLFTTAPGPTPAADADAVEAPADDALAPGLADVLAALAEAEPAVEREVDDTDDAPSSEDAPERFEPAAAQRRPIPLPDLPKDEEPEVDEQGGRRVLTVARTLRSGTAVRYDGDVQIFGDVNAGAQVRAGGSVVVLGRLRGMVHAGAHGDEDAFILAFDLSPTQLRIGKQIAIAPEKPGSDTFAPEIATVESDRIVIEPYRGRLGRR